MEDIKKLAESKKLTIGTERTLKELQNGNLQKILLAKNVGSEIKGRVDHSASIAEIPVEMLSLSNKEVGTSCKKSFAISCLGVLK